MTKLPADVARCLAHGIWPGAGSRKPLWCEARGECLRHVAIASDPQDGTLLASPRLCAVGEFTYQIPVEAA
jgi:hypothetical protein